MTDPDKLARWSATAREVTRPRANEVTIVGIDVPFLDIVGIIVKWTLASIPAAIMLGIVYLGFIAVFGTLIASLIRR